MPIPAGEWKRQHDEQVAKVLAELGEERKDFVSFAELAEVLEIKSVNSLRRLTLPVCGPPPEPTFTVQRSNFWRYADVKSWAALWIVRQVRKRAAIAAKARRREQAAALRAEMTEKHLTNQPSGASGFRGVRWHPYSSSFHAVLTLGYHQYQSLGYHKTAQEAARAVDRVRLALGWPAVNFPEDTETTLVMPDPRNRSRVHRGGRRGLSKLIERVALERGPLSVREIFETVQAEGGDTTQDTVRTALSVLCRQGRLGRHARGVYGPPVTPP